MSDEVTSYTYNTSTKKHWSLWEQNQRLHCLIQELKDILKHQLYTDNSKVALSLSLIDKQNS